MPSLPRPSNRLTLTTPSLLTAILFIAIFTMAIRMPLDTDSWWHLRSGQYIVENRAIFSADPFSHTQTGQPWFYPKGGQVFWYGLYALGGWAGLSLGLALCVTLAFALIWSVTPGNLYIRAFALLLGTVTTSLIWTVRPQMLSFVLAAWLLFALERYKRANARWIYALPLLTALWANLHGGYAIAFMLLATYIVGEALNRLTRHDVDPVLTWAQIGTLLLIGLISFLTVILNPYGWRMWTYPFMTVGIGALREFIQEWRSPNFHQPITWPFIVMLAWTLTVMGRSSRRVDWSDATLIGLWSVWSFFAVRNIGLYGLLAVPALARYSDAAIGHILPRPRPRSLPLLIRLNWLLLSIVLLISLLWIGLTLARNPQAIAESGLPVEAVEFIQTQQPEGPLFNTYNWGGYLLFTLWPDYPVYIDGRTDLYQDVFIDRYLKVVTAADGWSQILDDDGINLVLLENGSVIAKMMTQEPVWQEIYRDEQAVIFARGNIRE